MADVNQEQGVMTFTGEPSIALPLFTHPCPLLSVNDEREYHNAINSENEEDYSNRHPLLASEDARPHKIEHPEATAIIEDTKDSAEELARRIPWGYFLGHPASRTLLFAYWVMSWIGILYSTRVMFVFE